jgi:ribosomal protein S12 methylthiotransferase accessory factor
MAGMRIAGRELHQPKAHITSGTHRARSPRDTLADYARHMPRMGITRLANITGLDRVGIPVYIAIRPNSRSIATSQGKGFDRDHARASALMESIENWHAEHIELPARIESFVRLSDQCPVLDVYDIPLRPNATLKPDVPGAWLEGYDLLSDRPTWVPYECCTMNTTVTFSFTLTFYTSSNGLASGNHPLEAINHALFEVIERDSHAEWLDQPQETRLATKVRPETIGDDQCRTLLERFDAADIDVAIWDVTSASFQIPAYWVQVLDRDGGPPWRRLGAFTGRGCHAAPVVALSRALCEAAQARLTIIAGTRDDNPLAAYQENASEALIDAWRSQYVEPPAVRDFAETIDQTSDTFDGDLERILRALRSKGVKQAAIVDLSRPDVGISVVKAVVPGLTVATEYGRRAPQAAGRRRTSMSA